MHRFTVNRKYIAGTLNTGAVRVKMTFPLSPESASVTFRSRISEPILRVCVRDGQLKESTKMQASKLLISVQMAQEIYWLSTSICNDFDLIMLQKLKVYIPVFQLLATHVSN